MATINLTPADLPALNDLRPDGDHPDSSTLLDRLIAAASLTLEQIDTAAEAAAIASGCVNTGVWGALPEVTQDHWRAIAQAALTANIGA